MSQSYSGAQYGPGKASTFVTQVDLTALDNKLNAEIANRASSDTSITTNYTTSVNTEKYDRINSDSTLTTSINTEKSDRIAGDLLRKIPTISTSPPSGGADGDIWYEREA